MEKTKPTFTNKHLEKDVHQVLNTFLRSQEKGDLETLARCFLHNHSVVHIGTDMDEYYTSWRDYFHHMENVLPTKTGHEINEKETRIYFSDDEKTAWYSQLIDTCYETKGEITRIEGFRHTGILIYTPEGWKIVQSHISAPIETTI